jgi:signal transduction histidine kinase
MTDQPLPEPCRHLADLAPPTLPSYRSLRYDGGAMGVRLADIPPSDREVVVRMYAALQQVLAAVRDTPALTPESVARLQGLYADSWAGLLPAARELGATLALTATAGRLRQVFHDIKGGAFQALAVYLQLLALGGPPPAQLHRVFFLARDQLKIMRNALPELDPAGLARDEAQRLHAVELLVEKWQRAEHQIPGHAAAVTVSCHYTGAIAERCLEFAALDRIIYNLVNNAVRHSADGQVALTILPVAPDDPHHLRFVVANAVTPEQRRTLEQRFPDGPGRLFEGGFTTGGSGLGLRICADFVCNAYGLGDVAQGLAEGHFGAAVRDDQFLAWVHWPIAAD